MAGEKPVFGLPGHVTSAMVVFEVVVLPFLLKLAGKNSGKEFGRYCKAVLTRNIASAQGRTDFIRVMLEEKDDRIYATPVRGKSGLLNTMVKSDGLVEIPLNKEGLEKNSQVSVRLM
jgi:molybdopterin molybdotransferase